MVDSRNRLTDALHDAVIESLENMFFSEVSDVIFHWGSVNVIKPFHGRITVAFPRELIHEIAHDVYRVETPDITKAALDDIIAEVANTIAGRLVNTLLKNDETFELGVPETGVGKLKVGDTVSFINHYEMNNKIYLVMIEGEYLLSFREEEISKDVLRFTI